MTRYIYIIITLTCFAISAHSNEVDETEVLKSGVQYDIIRTVKLPDGGMAG